MKKMIGFFYPDEQEQNATPVPDTATIHAPVKSLVKVRFASHPIPLSYFNDRFDLHEGDVVYVSGKLASAPGIVVSVTTKFRIHTSDYERVLSVLDLTIHGSFTRVRDRMVSFGHIAITPDQFGSWVFPPRNPELTSEDDDEVVTGEGYVIDLSNLEDCEDITPAIAERAVNYFMEGRVRYLCVHNGIGRAYVEGTKWYRVDFEYHDGFMTEIFCDCPYGELCKHEAAVALSLRMLYRQPEFQNAPDFVALDSTAFWRLASRTDHIEL